MGINSCLGSQSCEFFQGTIWNDSCYGYQACFFPPREYKVNVAFLHQVKETAAVSNCMHLCFSWMFRHFVPFHFFLSLQKVQDPLHGNMVGNNSCRGHNSCFNFYRFSIRDYSCIGDKACFQYCNPDYACRQWHWDVSIGDYSCSGNEACRHLYASVGDRSWYVHEHTVYHSMDHVLNFASFCLNLKAMGHNPVHTPFIRLEIIHAMEAKHAITHMRLWVTGVGTCFEF